MTCPHLCRTDKARHLQNRRKPENKRNEYLKENNREKKNQPCKKPGY
jgi:hypothetical protein